MRVLKLIFVKCVLHLMLRWWWSLLVHHLIGIVHERGHEGVVQDGLSVGFRPKVFDFCISIAVIHHFSTPDRRREAIRQLLQITRSGGTILIFVWALEQEKNSKRRFETQDEMVPWKTLEDGQPVTYQRFHSLMQILSLVQKGRIGRVVPRVGRVWNRDSRLWPRQSLRDFKENIVYLWSMRDQ